MRRFHPLHTTLSKPERFTWPFCYEPHPLCLLAAEEVKREIARIEPSEGKMFGVLVVDTDEGLGFLAAYSGLLEGRNDWEYFVPPVYDAQQPDGYFKTREREIMQAEEHKQMSQELQIWLFRQAAQAIAALPSCYSMPISRDSSPSAWPNSGGATVRRALSAITTSIILPVEANVCQC